MLQLISGLRIAMGNKVFTQILHYNWDLLDLNASS